MIATKVGDLNGRWALMHKVTLALVPLMFISLITGILYQIRLNASMESFMELGSRYTRENATADYATLRKEFNDDMHAIESRVEANRNILASATAPDAARRLEQVERMLVGLQSDITSIKLSIVELKKP